MNKVSQFIAQIFVPRYRIGQAACGVRYHPAADALVPDGRSGQRRGDMRIRQQDVGDTDNRVLWTGRDRDIDKKIRKI